jgi:hypothetical protein
MAEAQMVNGKALVGYVGGVGVDSEGVPIEGAPKQPKNTDPSRQPGAQGAPSPEERMAIAIAQAITNPKALAAKGASASDKAAEEPDGNGEGDIELPVLAKLPRALKKLKSVEEVRAMQAKDDRAGAVEHYDARLAELSGDGEE